MEVESTIPPAKGRIAGFEGREGHRTPFASTVIIHSNCSVFAGLDHPDCRHLSPTPRNPEAAPLSGGVAGRTFASKKNRARRIATRSASQRFRCEVSTPFLAPIPSSLQGSTEPQTQTLALTVSTGICSWTCYTRAVSRLTACVRFSAATKS